MLTVILLAAAAAFWAKQQGHMRALQGGDIAAALAALVGLNAFRHGQPGIALLGIGCGAVWLWYRRKAAPPEISADEARALLELDTGADERAIRAAHRRLIARVHPDAGGSAELARRVNAARDLLLAELPVRSSLSRSG